MLKIGILLGDDIGLEVVPEAVKVMKAAAKKTGLEVEWQELPIGKLGHEVHGHTMPPSTVAALEKMDGFLCGPIGHAAYPRNDPTWIMPPLRKRLDLYASIKPVKSYPNIQSVHKNVDIVFLTDYTLTMGYFVGGGAYCDVNGDGYGDVTAEGDTAGTTRCVKSDDEDDEYVCPDATSACSSYAPAGSTRIDYVKTATIDSISTIFSTLEEAGSSVSAATVTFFGGNSSGDVGYSIDQALTDDPTLLEAEIGGYASTYTTLEAWTPHYRGLDGALTILESGDLDPDSEKIVIMLSDGLPTHDKNGVDCDYEGTSTLGTDGTLYCITQASVDLVDEANDNGIKIFTAAITTSSSSKGYMAHLSSDTCGTSYSSLGDCEQTGNVEYAYQAETAEEIAIMYEEIVASILDVTVGLTTEDSTVTTGTVSSGHNRELPFPSNFECTGEDIAIPTTISFTGSGYITMDNIQFQYCPAP